MGALAATLGDYSARTVPNSATRSIQKPNPVKCTKEGPVGGKSQPIERSARRSHTVCKISAWSWASTHSSIGLKQALTVDFARLLQLTVNRLREHFEEPPSGDVIGWEVIAALHRQETKHARMRQIE